VLSCCWADTTDVVPDDVTKDSISDWGSDSCDQGLTTADSLDLNNKADSSTHHVSETTADEGTEVWVDSVVNGGTSVWTGTGFSNDCQWNGPSDLPMTDTADRNSRQFTASVVVNTENKERCEFSLHLLSNQPVLRDFTDYIDASLYTP